MVAERRHVFVPREQMAGALQTASDLLPLTYAFDALARVAGGGGFGGRGWADVAVVVGARSCRWLSGP
jgi:ABC-2 type transport system permease protein